MDIFDYLSENQRECFRMRDPVVFEKDNEKYTAYLGRYPVVDLDLAIIVNEKNEVYFGWLREISLKNYSGEPSDKMLEILYKMTDNPLRKVKDIQWLGKKIEWTLESNIG